MTWSRCRGRVLLYQHVPHDEQVLLHARGPLPEASDVLSGLLLLALALLTAPHATSDRGGGGQAASLRGTWKIRIKKVLKRLLDVAIMDMMKYCVIL